MSPPLVAEAASGPAEAVGAGAGAAPGAAAGLGPALTKATTSSRMIRPPGPLPFTEASYTASLGSNPEFAPAAYRVGYISMVSPA